MYIADVVPLTNIPKSQPQVLSYFYKDPIEPGSLVVITLNNRKVKGIALNSVPIRQRKIALKSALFGLKKIQEVIKPAVVSEYQFKIASWISDYYFYPLGLALKTVLPAFVFVKKYQFSPPAFAKNYPEQKLILLPAISLADYYKNRYAKNSVSIIHGGLSNKQLFEEYQRIARGEVDTIIGTRAALFLPFRNLKEIIVTDGTAPNYWSEMTPKINSARTAKFIARLNDAKISYDGNDTTLTCEVKIIDMLKELRRGKFYLISDRLRQEIDDIRTKDGQILFYVNRRGYSNYVLCQKCANIIKCDNCEVPLVSHIEDVNNLTCHHCGLKKEMPKLCPQCGYYGLKGYGFGTQKIEEIVKRLFPGQKILRFDSDAYEKPELAKPAVEKIAKKEFKLIIATSLILGYRFQIKPDLAAILSADTLIKIPDFRMEERLFREISLLKEISPKVFIQTINSDNAAINFAAKGDFKSFNEYEIKNRKTFNYPPFSELIKLTYRHHDSKKAANESSYLFRKLENYSKFVPPDSKFELIGPSPAWIAKEKGKWVWNIIIKTGIMEIKKRNKSLRLVPPGWQIEVDPVTLL